MKNEIEKALKRIEHDYRKHCATNDQEQTIKNIIAEVRETLQSALDDGWQDISTAPEGIWILGGHTYKCCISGNNKTHCEIVCWSNSDGGFWRTNSGSKYKPDYWKPLPQPPKKGE